MGLDEAFEMMYGTPDGEQSPHKQGADDDPNESLKGDPTNTTGIARSGAVRNEPTGDEIDTVDADAESFDRALETAAEAASDGLDDELPVQLGEEQLADGADGLDLDVDDAFDGPDDRTLADLDAPAGDLEGEPAFMGADLDVPVAQTVEGPDDDVLALAEQVVAGSIHELEADLDQPVDQVVESRETEDPTQDGFAPRMVTPGDFDDDQPAAVASEPSSVAQILSFDPEAIRTVDGFPMSRAHDAELSSGASEEFRVLRTNLLSLQERRGIRSLTVSSCHHSEGKTTTATNLARFMAKSRDRRILLVDADIRRPKVKELLGLKVQFGLDDVLMGRCSLDQAMVFSEADNLMVLPTRRGHSNATELLELPLMDSLIETLDKQFDFVLYDSTPIFSTADPGVLGAKTDGIVLVIKAGTTYRESIEHALHQIEQAGGVVLGVILNQLRVYLPKYLSRYHYYQDYYYTDYYHRNRERDRKRA